MISPWACHPQGGGLADASLVPYLDPVFDAVFGYAGGKLAGGLQNLGVNQETSYRIAAGSIAIGSLVTTKKYTKSSLKIGQQKHKVYHAGKYGKEFRLPSGKRIDFLDINNRTIYELKPFNPRGIQQGQKQLQLYLKELQSSATLQKYPEFRGVPWKLVLDTY
jgi:hypothetical protein